MLNLEAKIVTLQDLVNAKPARKIGLCWGGFDFLHAGHILHFEYAKKMSATLIVGINSDRSFPDKGKNRPFFPEQQRARIVASVEYVDYVTIYDGPFLESEISTGIIHGKVQQTPFVPLQIIIDLKPDYYFKGIEYEGKVIPEMKLMQEFGGEVIYGPREPVFSSTHLLKDLSI